MPEQPKLTPMASPADIALANRRPSMDLGALDRAAREKDERHARIIARLSDLPRDEWESPQDFRDYDSLWDSGRRTIDQANPPEPETEQEPADAAPIKPADPALTPTPSTGPPAADAATTLPKWASDMIAKHPNIPGLVELAKKDAPKAVVMAEMNSLIKGGGK